MVVGTTKIAVLASLLAASSGQVGVSRKTDGPVTLTLVAEHGVVKPGGVTTLGLLFDMKPAWHVYWDGQNDTGQPPKFAAVRMPPGFEVGSWQWPAPTRKVLDGGILDYIYEKRAMVLVPVRVPKDAKEGEEHTLPFDVEWMQCADECQFASAKVEVKVRVGAEPGPSDDRIVKAREALPKDAGKDVLVRVSGNRASIRVDGASRLTFMPEQGSRVVGNALEGGTRAGDRLDLELGGGAELPVKGFLSIERSGKLVETVRVVAGGSPGREPDGKEPRKGKK